MIIIKNLIITSLIILIVFIILSASNVIFTPIAAKLFNSVDAIVVISRIFSYMVLITVVSYILFAIGIFRRNRISSIFAAVSALLVLVSVAAGTLLSNIVVGTVPTPLLVINAMHALAPIGFTIALALCLKGSWRIYGFITAGSSALTAILNGFITFWALSSSDNTGQRLSIMGTTSTLTGIMMKILMLVLVIGFLTQLNNVLNHQNKNNVIE